MKKLLTIVFLMLLGNAAIAQAPQGVSYQAVARNSAGAILASQPIGLRFSIHDATPTGIILYQETFSTTTTPLGLFSVNVGTGTVVSGTFNGITWGANPKFLQVEMDAAGGTSYMGMGTAQQMMSVPYSLYSNNGVPGGTTLGDMLYWNGSSWVRITAGTTGQILTVNTDGVPSWSSILLPVVTTGAVSGMTGVSASGTGSVTSAGGSSVTAYGVCWSTTPGAESLAGAHTTDGSGIGSFTSSITGLAIGVTYYLRAYATNSLGTAYGNEVSFSTDGLPALTTASVGSITTSSGIGGGNVTATGGASVTAYGVCWSTAPGAESASGAHTTDGSGTGSFTSNITGLAAGTTYYVKAYATSAVGTAYGAEVSFTTSAVVVPTLTTTGASSITSSGAVSGGNVTAGGGASVTAYGVCWSTTSGAETVSGTHTTDGSGTGSFTSNITGLAPGTTYYVMAYATNSAGTAYGTEVSFTTNAVVPSLATSSVSSITSSSGISGGNVTAAGGAAVTAYGVCWSTTSGAESVSGTHTSDGSGTGSFTSNITGLAPGTTYYVMAYATNSAGTAYGSEVSFTTNAVVPSLTTTGASSVTSSGATTGGNVTAGGGASVTAYGVCWSTTSGAETVSGTHTTDGSGTGSFTSNITGLAPGTTYYVMAYATNSAGTAYGTEVSFTTNAVVPTLATSGVSSITSSSGVSGGNVTATGGAAVTAYGVCWSTTSGAESVSGTHTSDGSGTGSFTSNITGLAPGTTYYVMAYATNSAGTAYGSEVSFTTNAVVPSLTTTGASSVIDVSATSGGNITSDGGAAVTARGVCWSATSGAETVSGTHTTDGSGIGSFTSNITGLVPGTTYYVMAYATNSAGTAYGTEVSFTTNAVVPTLATSGVSSITSSSGVSGGNVTATGGAAVTAYGVCWSTTSGAESVSGTHTSDGSGTGSFTSNITGLAPGTTYYVMAYATNSAGTAYGTQVSFTTSAVGATLTTAGASSVVDVSATSGGNITSDGGAAVTARGVCWSATSGAESISGTHTTDGSGTGSFTSSITGLTASTTYFVMAYATNSTGTSYGSEISFTTSASLLPAATTSAVTGITSSSFTAGGTVTSIGGAPVTARGIVAAPTPGATLLTGFVLPVGSGSGSFDTTISGVSATTTLYVKAYATNSYGTAYGSEVSFSTLAATLPVVATDSVVSISSTSANGVGTVLDDGGATVTYGVCWSTTSGAESIAGANIADGSGGGSSSNFSGFFSGLSSGTTYYLKAYATNSVGTAYGSEVSFTTIASSLPVVVTYSADSITSSGAVLNGNVTSGGGSPVTARGFMGSYTPGGEFTSGLSAPGGSGTGSFSFSIPHFTASTTLYYITYATNSFGTVYGTEMSFTTLAASLPTVSTDSVTSITTTSANGDGTVASDGGASVSDRGVCWSTSPGGESVSGSHISGGGGTGSYSTYMCCLTAGTTYYLKAYATNSVGTSYGSEVTFTTTSPTPPITVTDSVFGVTPASAYAVATITSTGGSSITSQGVCWSTTSGGELASGPHTVAGGTGTGSSTTFLNGLIGSTTYYVKSYAANSLGTSYGNEIVFTTLAPVPPTLTTSSPSSITATGAYLGGSISVFGSGATITSYGLCWSTTPGGESTAGSHTTNSGSFGSFYGPISGLSSLTTYYVKAYAITSAGTVYGNEVSFTTTASAPVMGTLSFDVGASRVTGIVTSDGAAPLTTYGFAYSATPGGESAPGTSEGTGPFTGSFNDFISESYGFSVTFYCKAYATNAYGTTYSNEVAVIFIP